MQIELSPELEAEVNERVASGRYASPGELIARALDNLFGDENEEAWTVDELREMLDEGLKDIEQGNVYRITSPEESKAYFDDLLKECHERHAARLKSTA